MPLMIALFRLLRRLSACIRRTAKVVPVLAALGLSAGLAGCTTETDIALTVTEDGSGKINYRLAFPEPFKEVFEAMRMRATATPPLGIMFERGLCAGLTPLSALSPDPTLSLSGSDYIADGQFICDVTLDTTDFARAMREVVDVMPAAAGLTIRPDQREISINFPPRLPSDVDLRDLYRPLVEEMLKEQGAATDASTVDAIIEQDIKALIAMAEIFGDSFPTRILITAPEIVGTTGALSPNGRTTSYELDLAAFFREQLDLPGAHSERFIVTFRY